MAKGIYKRKNIFWIRYAGLDGRTVYESASDKFKEAEVLLIQRRQSIKEGKQPDIKKMASYTFYDLAAEYIKWCERQRGFRQKVNVVKQLAGIFGSLPLRSFDTRLIEQYQSERLQKGNKPATPNRHIAIIKHMFTKAVDWKMAGEPVLKGIRKAKQLPENNRRLRYLSREECQELISQCQGNIKAIVITALNAGMRKGEILSLKWDNVDLKHGFILLDVTKNGERREIPINNSLRATLQGLTRRLDSQYVFCNPDTGNPYDKDLKRSFNTALRRAGIKDFHFHDLRHTFASHLVMAGVDITTVSRLLGHKSLTMTLRYSHLAPEHLSRAVDILDKQLRNLPTIQRLYNQAVVSNV